MKSFATIVVSTLLLFAYVPAFAHGGHGGMNGMNGNNTQFTMKTPTPNATPIPTQTHNITKYGTTDHTFGHHHVFLRVEERILMRDINRLKLEIAKLQGMTGNSTRVTNLNLVLSRLEMKLFRIRVDLGQVS